MPPTTTAPEPETASPDETTADASTGDIGVQTVSPIEFGPCGQFANAANEPPPDGWECGVLTTAMDPLDPGGPTVDLAVTRRVGARSRGEALVVNPGGPGGAGLPFVWALADTLPADVTRWFDIVAWDPRGTGASTPTIACPRRARWADPELIDRCAEATGDVMAHMSTPNHVEDLEQLRLILGQARLNYLGYSYGTYLGAAYANRYPGSVGRFVLDGAVDPASGTARAPDFAGDPWYAADETDEVTDRFFELCDATDVCGLGSDSSRAFDEIAATVTELPTNGFPGELSIDTATLEAVFASSMYDPFNWGLLATALEDARAGDGSTLDALADLFEVSDAYFGEIVDITENNEAIANLAIYCADFQAHPDVPAYCDGLPRNDFRPAQLDRVDVADPILVIGTAYDPSTPVRHTAELATRLDDAVELYWDGIGHTAFPFNSLCVDDAVAAYLVDGQLPEDGTHCEFVSGVDDDLTGEIGDYLFALPPSYVEPWLQSELESAGGDDAGCEASRLSGAGDRIVVHVILGVDSPAATAALDKAAAACSVG